MDNLEFCFYVVGAVQLFKIVDLPPKSLREKYKWVVPLGAILLGAIIGGIMYWNDPYLMYGIRDGAFLGAITTGVVNAGDRWFKNPNINKVLSKSK